MLATCAVIYTAPTGKLLVLKGYMFGGLMGLSRCSIPGKRRQEKWRQRLLHGGKTSQIREQETP
jgi:hypothetical protein